MERTKYDVFISYSRKDYVDDNGNIIQGNVISQIKEVFNNSNISFWFDEEGIHLGDEYMKKLAEAIADSSIILFISSVNSNSSEWTAGEIGTAHLYKKKIIPFRLDESPFAKSIIVKIASLNYIDYYQNHEKAFSELVKAINIYKEEQEQIRIEDEKRKEQLALLARMDEIRKEIQSLISDYKRLNSQQHNYLNQIYEKKESLGENKKRCPVCDKEQDIRTQYCERCGLQYPLLFSLDSNTDSFDILQLSIAKANWSYVNDAKRIKEENDIIKKDNSNLTSKLKTTEQEKKRAQEQVEALKGELKRSEEKFNKASKDYMYELLDKKSSETVKLYEGDKYGNIRVKNNSKSQNSKNVLSDDLKAEILDLQHSKEDIFQFVKSFCNNKNIKVSTNLLQTKMSYSKLSQALNDSYNITLAVHTIKSYITVGDLIDAIWKQSQ